MQILKSLQELPNWWPTALFIRHGEREKVETRQVHKESATLRNGENLSVYENGIYTPDTRRAPGDL